MYRVGDIAVVLNSSDVLTGPPSIISLNISEPCLKHGSNVSLRCYTNGFPRPNIEFLQDNVRIIPGEGEFKNFVQEYFDEVSMKNKLSTSPNIVIMFKYPFIKDNH